MKKRIEDSYKEEKLKKKEPKLRGLLLSHSKALKLDNLKEQIQEEKKIKKNQLRVKVLGLKKKSIAAHSPDMIRAK